MISRATTQILLEEEWMRLAANHRERAHRHTLPERKRRDRGLPNPVEDFLFQYYPSSLALLEKWHPGLGVSLKATNPNNSHAMDAFLGKYYTHKEGLVFLDTKKLSDKEHLRLKWIADLLDATANRAPNFACHGLHEWAMVYRGKEVRHEKTTLLRLPQSEIDALVESHTLCCSHHDAFRFFADEARPMNRLQPDLDSRLLLEQPGCVHANMDLYKWAAKAMPWIGSELLLDCFELAIQLRDLDMRASPYDLTSWGREPIRIETAEGRRIYEAEQKRLADLAIPLRERLIQILRETLI